MKKNANEKMLTVEEVDALITERGIDRKAFWSEAAGGDKVPMTLADVERVAAAMANERYVLEFEYPQGSGESFHVEGANLEELRNGLVEQGYDGPSVAVHDAGGFTKGWVSAQKWTYA